MDPVKIITSDQVWEIIADVFNKYGPFAALYIIMNIFTICIMMHLYGRIIKAKDREIDRLVKERNRLQDNILERPRLSTKETGI